MQTSPWSEFALQKQLADVKDENDRLRQEVFDLSHGRVQMQTSAQHSRGGALVYPPSSSSSIPSSVRSAPIAGTSNTSTFGGTRGRGGAAIGGARGTAQHAPLSASRVANRPALTRGNSFSGTNSNSVTAGKRGQQQQHRQANATTRGPSVGASSKIATIDNTASLDDRQRRRAQLSSLYGGPRSPQRSPSRGGGGSRAGSAAPREDRKVGAHQLKQQHPQQSLKNSLISRSVFSNIDTGQLSHQLRSELAAAAGAAGPSSYGGYSGHDPFADPFSSSAQRQHQPANGSSCGASAPLADPKKELLRQLAENGERLAAILSAGGDDGGGGWVDPAPETVNHAYREEGNGYRPQNSYPEAPYHPHTEEGSGDAHQRAWEEERRRRQQQREETDNAEEGEEAVDVFTRLTYQPTGHVRHRGGGFEGGVLTYTPRPKVAQTFDVGAALAVPGPLTGQLSTVTDRRLTIGATAADPLSYAPQPPLMATVNVGEGAVLPAVSGGGVGSHAPNVGLRSVGRRGGGAPPPVAALDPRAVAESAHQDGHGALALREEAGAALSAVHNSNGVGAGTTTSGAAGASSIVTTAYRRLPYYAKHDPYYRPPPQPQQTLGQTQTQTPRGHNAYSHGGTGGGNLGASSAVRHPTSHAYGEIVGPDGRGTGVTPPQRIDQLRDESRLATLSTLQRGAVAAEGGYARIGYGGGVGGEGGSHLSDGHHGFTHSEAPPIGIGGDNNGNHATISNGHGAVHNAIEVPRPHPPPRPLDVLDALEGERRALLSGHGPSKAATPPPSLGGTQNSTPALALTSASNPYESAGYAYPPFPSSSSAATTPTAAHSHRNGAYSSAYASLVAGGTASSAVGAPLLTSSSSGGNGEGGGNGGAALRPPSNSGLYDTLMRQQMSGVSFGGAGLTSLRRPPSGAPSPTAVGYTSTAQHQQQQRVKGRVGGGSAAPSPMSARGGDWRPTTGNSTISMGSLDGTRRVRDLLSWANNL